MSGFYGSSPSGGAPSGEDLDGFYGPPPQGGVSTGDVLDGFYGESSLGPPINDSVVRAEAARDAAEASAIAAEQFEVGAEVAAVAAQDSANDSQSSAVASQASANDSEYFKNVSESAAVAAANSASNTETIYDQFDDRYLGGKSSAPTVDNDGNTLLVGALYWNTTTDAMYVWTGTTWDGTAFGANSIGVKSVAATSNGQTVFIIPGGYLAGRIIVTLNGSTLVPADYIATNETTVVLTDGADVKIGWTLVVFVLELSGGGGGGAVDSVNGQTGVVVLDAADVGADPSGAASGAVAAHIAAGDPHPQYTTLLEASAAAPVQSVNGSTGAVVIPDATTSVSGLMVGSDKTKLDGLSNYTHPANHPPSIITQDASNRFVTDAEKATWNAKGVGTVTDVSGTAPIVSSGGATPAISITAATTGAAGSMSAADKLKLDGLSNYTHPASHPPSIITQDASNRFFTDTERTKLTGIADSANNYTHPANHPPSIITQDASNRFFTDTERTKLTGIATGATANTISSANPLMDGAVSAGVATALSREDHRHPTDTSRQAVITIGTTAPGSPVVGQLWLDTN